MESARALRESLIVQAKENASSRFFNQITQLSYTQNITQRLDDLLNELFYVVPFEHGLIARYANGVLTICATKGKSLPIGTRIPMMGTFASLLKAPVQFKETKFDNSSLWSNLDEKQATYLFPIANYRQPKGLLALAIKENNVQTLPLDFLMSTCGLLGLILPQEKTLQSNAHTLLLLEKLTPREREIFALLPSGSSNLQLAQKLQISPGTVKIHVERILTKLEANDRTQAAVIATKLGF